MTRGTEDKQTSKRIKLHPRVDQVRWRSEHCWIHDHPRTGTVYSHAFLFPSEVGRVAKQVNRAKEIIKNTTSTKISSSSLTSEVPSLPSDPGLVTVSTSTSSATSTGKDDTSTIPVPEDTGPWTWDLDRRQPGLPSPAATPLPPSSPFLSRRTVSDFRNRYTFPLSNLTIPMQVDALIEGSAISRLRSRFPLHSNATSTPAPIGDEPKWDEALRAWEDRETHEQRYALWTLRARGVHDSSAPIEPPSVGEGGDEDAQSPDMPASTWIFGPRGIKLGGTVVVHFIKRNEWFLEAAMAMLGPNWNGDEGRINPREPNSAEGAKTIISKTQSFKRKRDEAPIEDDSATSDEDAIPLEDDGLVYPGVDQAP